MRLVMKAISRAFAALQQAVSEVVNTAASNRCMPDLPVAPVREGGYGSHGSSAEGEAADSSRIEEWPHYHLKV
jgi:hypothetical protein